MREQNKYDVIVVGGGLIGAAFALKLAQDSNYRILVLERSAPLTDNITPNQRVLALGKVATTLLKEIGVFEEMQSTQCYPYTRMLVWDDASEGELEFSAHECQLESLGHMVDANSLTILLQAALEQHSQITVNYQHQIDRLLLESDAACIGNNRAPLVVAADGVNSWCRQQAKIFANTTDYRQKGIVARIQTQLSHQDTAWQVFLNSGPIGLLPLANNQCSIVWSADNQMADELLALSEVDFAEELARSLQGRLGDIEILSQRQAFPLASMKAQTYFKHRLALVGDAAHSIHPLAGQGANLGFKDIVALVEQLTAVQNPSLLGELTVLARYQRNRKADNEQTNVFMNALYNVYKTDLPWWSTLRGVGMNWISRSKRIKSMLISQAMG